MKNLTGRLKLSIRFRDKPKLSEKNRSYTHYDPKKKQDIKP